jgi:hypothetical protein
MVPILNVLMPAPAFGAQRGSRRLPPARQRTPLPGVRMMQGWQCRYGALVSPLPTGGNGMPGGEAFDPSVRVPL